MSGSIIYKNGKSPMTFDSMFTDSMLPSKTSSLSNNSRGEPEACLNQAEIRKGHLVSDCNAHFIQKLNYTNNAQWRNDVPTNKIML